MMSTYVSIANVTSYSIASYVQFLMEVFDGKVKSHNFMIIFNLVIMHLYIIHLLQRLNW